MVAGAEKACVCVLQYLNRAVGGAVLCCAVVRAGENRTEQRKKEREKESARTYLIKSVQKSELKLFSCNPPRWVW